MHWMGCRVSVQGVTWHFRQKRGREEPASRSELPLSLAILSSSSEASYKISRDVAPGLWLFEDQG